MKANLIYKGLYSGNIHKKSIILIHENALGNLLHSFNVNYPRVSQHANDVDILQFRDGEKLSDELVCKYEMFTEGKISEMSQLVAIEEE